MNRLALTAAAPLRRGEVVVAFGVLLAFCAAVFGSHVLHGGLYTDDWNNAAIYRFPTGTGHDLGGDDFAGAIERFYDANVWRPVLAVYLPLTHAIFGTHASLHLAWAVVLTALMASSFYWVLRELGLERIHAFGIALLVAIFPASDSMTMWSTSSVIRLAIAIYLWGVIVALKGLQADGRRRVLLHAGAIALYVLSILTYEITALAALGTFLVYAYRSSWSEAMRRAPFDWIAIVVTLLTITSRNPANTHTTIGDWIDHAWQIFEGSLEVLANAVVPFGHSEAVGLAAFGLLVATGVLLVLFARSNDPVRGWTERWLLIAGAALLLVAAGYLVFVPPPAGQYEPPGAGITERNNALAALGFAVMVYALVMIAAGGVRRLLGRPRLARAAAAALVLTVGVGYLIQVGEEKRRWDDAAEIQRQIESAVEPALERANHGDFIFTSGPPGAVALYVPAFWDRTDLNGAVKVWSGDPTISGQALFDSWDLTCAGDRLLATDSPWLPTLEAEYGSLILVDVNTERVLPIANSAQCRHGIASLDPGPFIKGGLPAPFG